MLGFTNKRSRRRTAGRSNAQRLQRRRLLLERLDERALMAADLGLLDEGLEGRYFDTLQQTLNDQVLSTPAPLVGDALGTWEVDTSQFIQVIGDKLAALDFTDVEVVTTEMARQRLSEALDVTADSVQVVRDEVDDVRFEITLRGDQLGALVDLDLVGADPEIELKLGGEDQVALDVDWNYLLSFGVREVDGVSAFYVDTSAADELEIAYSAAIRSAFTGDEAGTGQVGVFVAEFAVNDNPSRFSGSYVLDVLGGIESPQIAGQLTGSGDAYLDVSASFFPTSMTHEEENLINFGVTAEAHVGYDTELLFAADGKLTASNNAVTVAMNDVTLDLGSIYEEFVDPIVGHLQDGLRPAKPALDMLTEPLPLIGDLYAMAGWEAPTALSVGLDAGVAAGKMTADQAALVEKTINGLQALVNYRGLDAAESGTENQFSFRIDKSGVDPQSAVDREKAIQDNLAKIGEDGFFPQLADKHKPGADSSWKSGYSWAAEFEGAIDIPLLTDHTVLAGMLLGDTSSQFFTFDAVAAFDFELEVDVPIAPLLNMVSLTGGIGFEGSFNLSGGYDATGIQRLTAAADFSSAEALRSSLAEHAAVLNQGFYLNDHNDDAGGHLEGHGLDRNGYGDAPEITLTTTVDAGVKAGLDLVLLSFEVHPEIELGGSLTFDLNDLPEPESWSGDVPYWENVRDDNRHEWVFDGRVRPYELSTIVDADPTTLVNVGGELKAAMKVGLEFAFLGITLFDEEYRVAETTLVKGQISQPNDYRTIHGSRPVLGQLGEAGDLTLFMGDTAGSRRNAGNNELADESFEIRSLGSSRLSTDENPLETVMVTFLQGGEEYTQFFDGVRHIRAHGGAGDDSIVAVSGLRSGVTLIGGAGNDTLTNLGAGHANLQGGSGDDVLQGGIGGGSYFGYYDPGMAAGSDVAADGDDEIYGGAGADLVWAGAGDDLVKTYGGNDVIHGEDGDDRMLAGSGDDALYGGAGDDTLQGAEGADAVFGQGGRDTIQVEVGHVVTQENPSAESTAVNGTTAVDIVDGGAQVDTLEILGTAHRDEMTITQVGDPLDHVFEVRTISTKDDAENGGPPQVEEFVNRFQLQGSVETITVSGLEGDDMITAVGEFNVNSLTLSGGVGDDTLQLENAARNNPVDDVLAQNWLLGGLGDDTLRGSMEADILDGGAGSDKLYGGGGNDVIFGGAGNDFLDGGAGEDDLLGGAGEDVIYGGEGATGDVMEGGSGADHIYGGEGVDDIFGGEGDDFLFGGGGDDVIHGDAGSDHLYGQGGWDGLYGGEGDDFLYAYDEHSTSEPGLGIAPALADRLFGGGGDDFLLGSDYYDRLRGGAGNDVIVHTAGGDSVNGGVEESSDTSAYLDEYRVRGTSDADDLVIEATEFEAGGAVAFGVRARGEDRGILANLMGIDIVGVEALGGNDLIEVDFGENAGLQVRIDVGEGDDTIQLNSFQNNSELFGGAGLDTVMLQLLDTETTQDNRIELSDTMLATSETQHALSGFERAELTGNANANVVDVSGFHGEVVAAGLAGNDLFVLGAGAGFVDGGEGVNRLEFQGGSVTLSDSALVKANGTEYGLSEIHTATLQGGGGNDTIDASSFGGAVTIDGGLGDDQIMGGSSHDVLRGGAGDDQIRGGAGNDRLIGGAGSDKIWGGAGDDWLNGEAGESIFSKGVDLLYGGAGEDTLIGYYDYLYGDDGADELRAVSIDASNFWRLMVDYNYEMRGGGGDDRLYGGGLGDRLFGGSGNDRLYGYGGDDYLYGGSGNDRLYGYQGDDRLYGQTGNDRLYGYAGDDTLSGGDGKDYLYGSSGNDSLHGGNGVDRLYGQSGNDHLDGGRDGVRDYLYGGSGWNTGVQYRVWNYNLGWFGGWAYQDYLSGFFRIANRNW